MESERSVESLFPCLFSILLNFKNEEKQKSLKLIQPTRPIQTMKHMDCFASINRQVSIAHLQFPAPYWNSNHADTISRLGLTQWQIQAAGSLPEHLKLKWSHQRSSKQCRMLDTIRVRGLIHFFITGSS